ncbi:MAG: ABC transporter ATP-binding protein [Chlamydiota bacterium]
MKKRPILQVNQLSVSYAHVLALWDVTFSLDTGVMVAVVGPNGAGKSTLLQAILGVVKPLSGQALIFGQPAHKQKKKIAYVPQKKSLDWNFPVTVLDVALMGRYHMLGALKWYRKRDKEAALAVLQQLQLDRLAQRQISELSGGQQQRLFLARALLQEPDIFFLDEPFAGVDQATEKALVATLHELRDQGKTILIVHHDLQTVATYFDSVLLLKTSLITHGAVETTLTQNHLKTAFDRADTLFHEARVLAEKEKAGLR